MANKTFKDYYNEEKKKDAHVTPPPNPSKVWVMRVAKETRCSEQTVRGWLCGSRVPNKLTIETIAKLLKARPEELFPITKNNDNENN